MKLINHRGRSCDSDLRARSLALSSVEVAYASLWQTPPKPSCRQMVNKRTRVASSLSLSLEGSCSVYGMEGGLALRRWQGSWTAA